MSEQDNGYYDFDIVFEEELLKNSTLDDIFYMRDLKQRKLFLTEDVDMIAVEDITRHIMQINREDAGLAPEDRKPILLYIASYGGEVDSGFVLIDTILTSKTPVYTINIGFQYSMGFLIGIAGHKRFTHSNSKFLLHDGYNFIGNSSAKVQDQMKFEKRSQERIKSYILSQSKLSSEEYDEHFREEWYMFAEDAKKYGFTDYIIGVDCELDEVV